MVRAIIFASALMIGSVALAQDAAPSGDTPPAADAAAAPSDAAAAPADTPPAAAAAAAPAGTDYPPCSAKVTDHCTQGAHKGASHRSAKRSHHK